MALVVVKKQMVSIELLPRNPTYSNISSFRRPTVYLWFKQENRFISNQMGTRLVLRFDWKVCRRSRNAFDDSCFALQAGVLLDIDMASMGDPVDSRKQNYCADDYDRPIHVANIRQVDREVHWKAGIFSANKLVHSVKCLTYKSITIIREDHPTDMRFMAYPSLPRSKFGCGGSTLRPRIRRTTVGTV